MNELVFRVMIAEGFGYENEQSSHSVWICKKIGYENWVYKIFSVKYGLL